jgi:alpha-2-macroglobulin
MREIIRLANATIAMSLIIGVSLFFTCCSRLSDKRLPDPPSPEFARYISAFSSGILPGDAGIQVRFAFDLIDSSSVGSDAEKAIMEIRPVLKGRLFWKDTRTLEFRPDEKMPHDKVFNVNLHLGRLLNVDDQFRNFRFGFKTMPQTAALKIERVQTFYNNQQPFFSIHGLVETADAADPSKVREMITMNGVSGSPKVSWQHQSQNRKHSFVVENIPRGSTALDIVVSWNGKPIDAAGRGSKQVSLPAPGKFELIHTQLTQMPEPRISLQFSEPLRENQNLAGLIYFADNNNLSTRINGNEIVIFLNKGITGRQILSLETAIRDLNGNPLAEKVVREFVFEDLKPSVKLRGKGTIIPSSNNLLFPFEAVNLAAVDVSIIRIYENNIHQFFQVNQVDGDEQLRRVGRIVARRTLPLATSGVTNLNQWNKYAIDLSEVITPEPGAIYRVSITWKREYSRYPCGDNMQVSDAYLLATPDTGWESISDEIRYWGSYDDYSYYPDYDWYERDNPCHNTYYYNKSVSRNVLASDLGIIAKKGSDGTFHFVITDIVSTAPQSGVTISLYNFQQQLLESVTTGRDGSATVKARGVPFLAVAAKGSQRGYLRLDDGTSLSLSMFDVEGAAVQQGIKAFIYGDRGVWRPGDTLFLNLIIEDKQKQLPQNYPVIFQLYTPLGQMVQNMVNNKGTQGFYHFKTFTSSDAPTGNWMARFKLGGIEFSKSLRIEAIMPNRLRINTSFDNNRLLGYTTSSGFLKAEWLHGAAARNMRAEITATLSPAKTQFSSFKDFSFDDPTRSFYSETFTLFSSRLDATGQADISARISVSTQAPGVLRANIETKVFEEGGAFSVDRFNLPFYPYETYSGIQAPQPKGRSGVLYTDSIHPMQLISVDKDGKLIPSSRLRVDVYKISWRWWWDSGDEYFGDFSSGSYNSPIHTQTLQAPDGRATYNFKVDYPEWGRYLILVTNLDSQHRAGQIVHIDWPAWYGASREGRQLAASMLSFSTHKEKYQVGEDITFTFPSSAGGRALVSIENGTGVLSTQWVQTGAGNTSFNVKATAAMTPNVYAHITLLQPHEQTLNDLPIRLYGVMPVFVEDPATRLQPVITMPDVLKPEQSVSISVKEQQGKAMTYTIALVDEGLLDLTRFATPEPWKHFYAREALGVKTWDMFDQVMGAFGSEFSRLLAIGGDDEIQPPVAGERATRFKPVVRFFGPFALDRCKSHTHTFTMPQYIGSVRVMVVAGQNGAYGHADKTVPVKQSLMAVGTLPRVLGPGETVKFPVNVFAMDETVKNATISIESNEMLMVKGNATQNLTFSEPGDKLAWFEMQTPQKEGVARVKTTVKSGNEIVVFDIELDVRNANPRLTSVESVSLDGSSTQDLTITLTGMENTRDAILEISSIPPVNLEKRLKFLTGYPHGCTEQIISAAFPQLYLETFTELDAAQKEKIQGNVQSVIDRITQRQLSNGGISTWPGSTTANDWITNYAGHFLLEALSKGFTLPAGFIDSWRNYQREIANRWMPDVNIFGSDLMQAYRLYTLSLSGQPEMGAMNRLRQRENLSDQAKWQLAAAYQLAGQTDAARELAESAQTTINPYSQMSYTYGSHHRDKAMIIQVLSMMGQKPKAEFLVRELSDALSSSVWMSTQTTAFGLMALSKFYEGSQREDFIHFSVSEDGGAETTSRINSLITRQQLRIPSGTDTKRVRISNKGQNTLYARVIYSGIPLAGEEQAGEENIRMQVRFTDTRGNAVNVQQLKQGASVIAEVTLANTGTRGDYKELALTRIFPSGWEISNVRMDAAASALRQDEPNYEDIRDDRVYTYFDLSAGKSKTFKVMLTATYEGKFYLPGFNVEAMYDASVYARNRGMWIEVVRE